MVEVALVSRAETLLVVACKSYSCVECINCLCIERRGVPSVEGLCHERGSCSYLAGVVERRRCSCVERVNIAPLPNVDVALC